ncbi:MAG: ATP-dependent zinc metalloprotease FtsH [Candidatus Pacebacteria bacterium]|nr:ATP-dependent zinc metalloprotease FtsH [Candidatus Paceibacterota bacterium]
MDPYDKKPNNKGNRKNSRRAPEGGKFWRNIITVLLVFLLLASLYSVIVENQSTTPTIAISELVQDINAGKVSSVTVEGDTLNIEYKKVGDAAPETKTAQKENGTALTDTLAHYGVDLNKAKDVKIEVKDAGGFLVWVGILLPFFGPIILIVVFLWFMTRQVKGSGMQAFTFGQSKARLISPHDKKQRVTFKDVAGNKEAKQELFEIVDFLKYPKKFLDIGARIPKGILLMGAPGTGKTLLARAVAGEAGVSFFSISGSEFVEMFVGVGASRVRDLFKMAKTAAPAIIFIDEIDAVGRSRGGGVGGGNDEREQTLNQILVEMDGFEPNEKVIVMAATNRPDVLDPALLRPGRFDRRVVLDLPDRADREEILQIHSKEKPFAEDVDLKVIAERTPGFSGADLYSLMNEGAILAARENRTKIAQYDLIRSIEKVMLGPERKSHILSAREKEITAYHEAGHAIIASVLEYADPVHKVSIISRGRAAGYTLKLPIEERRLQSKKEFLDDIAVSLGGYVVEKTIFGDLTTGSSNDLQVSTSLARDMITKYGMSEVIGPVALESTPGLSPTGKISVERDYSEKTGSEIDKEVLELMNREYVRALDVITKYRTALNAIAKELIVVETIERAEFEKILIANGIMPKKKKILEPEV